MRADFEILTGVVRVFENEDATPFVDRYCGSATVQFSDHGKTATVLGLTMCDTKVPLVTCARQIRSELMGHGAEQIEWSRIKDGNKHRVCCDCQSQ